MDNSCDPATLPMRISDAVGMFRREINKNERPYTKAILLSNNTLLDEWENTILKKICNREGKIKAGQVWFEWQYFYTGKIIGSFIEHLEEGLVVRPSKERVDYWIKIFETSSIENLIKIGAPLVGYGWKLLLDDDYIDTMLNRWEKIYKNSNDPLDWRKLSNDYPKLWSENTTVISTRWDEETLKDIQQKVMTIIKTPVQPYQ